MNQEQLTSLARQLLLSAAGGFITRGYVSADTANFIVGVLIFAGTSGWALYTRRTAGLIASAANLPEVKTVVVTDPLIAAAAPANVVHE